MQFKKMHGLGNDFVILDARTNTINLEPKQIRKLTDRHKGIGCDQVIIMWPGEGGIDVQLQIFNADASSAEACGNATRCVAALLMEEYSTRTVTLAVDDQRLPAWKNPKNTITVDMGIPQYQETLDVSLDDLDEENLSIPVWVSMRNPHIVFFTKDVQAVPLKKIARRVQQEFTQGINVSVAEVWTPTDVKLRVWERGVGITQACGSAACATVVATVVRGLTEREVCVILDGGTLHITYDNTQHVLMTGPVQTVFTGTLDPNFLS